MRIVKGRVVGSTVVLDEVLPEGSEVEVVLRSVDDEPSGWDLSSDDWAEIDRSIAEADKGLLIPAQTVLDGLAKTLEQ